MGFGYLDWDTRYISGVPQLDGQSWQAHGIPLQMNWKEADAADLFAIPTASGEHVLQSPIADDAASDRAGRFIFDLPMQLIDETVHKRLLMAAAKNATVNFVPYVWCMEHFLGQTSGAVRSLARPVAWGYVAGVTSGTHPIELYTDGVVDPAAAALSGTGSQVITMGQNGDIAIWYMPVFRVLVRAVSTEFQDTGGAVCTVTLEEVRRYA